MGSAVMAFARFQLRELLDDLRFWGRELGALAREVGRLLRWAARVVWGARAAVLHAAAVVFGWVGVTAGVASTLEWWGLAPWPLSGGLFLLSLAGWRHLRMVFSVGLYDLHRFDEKARRS